MSDHLTGVRPAIPLIALAAVGIAAGGTAFYVLQPGPTEDREASGGSGQVLHEEEASLEVPELASAEVMQQAFLLARSELGQDVAPAADLGGYPGRRVYLCAYRLQPRAVCGEGNGDSLAASVRAAAADLARHEGAWPDALLKMDLVVSEAEARWNPLGKVSGFRHGVGVHGIRVEQNGERSWLTPSEIMETGAWAVRGEGKGSMQTRRLVTALIERNPSIGALKPSFTFTRFRTASWVETAPGGALLRTYRLHPFEQAEPEPDLLLQRAVWATEYLVSSVDANGRIRYLFDPVRDAEQPGYNLLRHAGTTWSMIQAWERVEHDPWLEPIRAAIDHLLANSEVQEREGPFGGGETRWVKETKWIKLGGAGLGLLMLAEYTAATGDTRYLEEARQFARYLVSAQKESGEFVYFSHPEPGREPRDRVSAYYPGEAIVGLMRLYSIDPDPLWKETARRGARWLIEVRDGGKSAKKLANDHWLMIGLSRLYAETEEPIWLEHSLKLAEAVAWQQRRHEDHVRYHRDYRGGYYEPPRSTPAATRGEGLVAVLDTCRLAGHACEKVRENLVSTVRHELQTQYIPENMWWLPEGGTVFGAFYGGLVDPTVRNDYVQHNLSSVLGLERHLRSEEGIRLPGDPRWSPADQAAFTGVPSEQVDALRAAALAIRGASRWDAQAGNTRREAGERERVAAP